MSILVVLVVILFRYVLAPMRLNGVSMEPSYLHGQFSIANRLAYIRELPARGDVVAVRLRDTGRSVFLLKRIVGLPGERIGFESGRVTVNGRRLEEAYLGYQSDWEREPVLCAEDEYFVVGDNRSMPIRDHTFGRASLTRIVGKVIF